MVRGEIQRVATTGPAGFRITTKIHPFWNLYFNGLRIAIAETFEPKRSARSFISIRTSRRWSICQGGILARL